MNRPNKENYYLPDGTFAKGVYIIGLEMCCDELEKALDKACKELSFAKKETYKKGTICPIKGNWCTDNKDCAECLKEWLLRDE